MHVLSYTKVRSVGRDTKTGLLVALGAIMFKFPVELAIKMLVSQVSECKGCANLKELCHYSVDSDKKPF